ncbi:glycosyltransferase family 4 protein [Geminocystis sp. CENA526]|uniref:glycosyltransferase family 4 protein n=1 Tax=Geminocystis sp. CENA526 TaxID=1355871 RepID=UPI003D6DF4E7
MKILVVTHYFPAHRGGVEIVAGELISQWCNQGLEVTWIASNNDPSPQLNNNLQCISIESNNIIEKKLGFAYPLWNIFKVYRQLWRQIKQVDIIHIHEYIYLGNILAFYIAKQQKKPIIITQHIGFIPFSNPVFCFLLKLVNYTLGKLMLTRVDRVVFCSKVIEEYWLKLKPKFCQKPIFIPNGVDTNIFYPVDNQARIKIREELALPQDKLTILFVGRFVEKKGLNLLEKLAKNYHQITWVFVGWGSLNPQNWGLSNVYVWENLEKSVLTPLYQTADLLILPSTGEAFPLVIQEAMACGTPAFVSTESANQYPQLENMIFSAVVNQPHSEEEWHNKTQEIINNPALLSNLRAEVSHFAQEYWCWEKTADSYLQVFQKLL